MRIVYKAEKKKILEKLSYYGITKVPHLLLKFGKEKIRGYSGDLSIDEIAEIDKTCRIELMGLYLFHEYAEEVRLSLDALHTFKDQITKNIIELTDQQAEQWFRGEDLQIEEIEASKNLGSLGKGFKILKHDQDFIGCGKLTDNRIVNYMPKERRIKGKQV